MIIDDDTTLGIFASRYLENLSTQDLLEWIDDPEPKVRTLIARKLQCRGTENVFNFCKEWAISSVVYQREIAAFILGQLGCLFKGKSKYPFKFVSKNILMTLVNDTNSEVRAAAIAAFGHLYRESLDKDIEKLILEYANDESIEVKIAVAVTLGSSSGNIKVREIYSDYLNSGGELAEWARIGLEILEDRCI